MVPLLLKDKLVIALIDLVVYDIVILSEFAWSMLIIVTTCTHFNQKLIRYKKKSERNYNYF